MASFPLPLIQPFDAVVIAAVLPFLPHLVKAFIAHGKLPKGYDLRNPRASVAAAADNTETGRLISRLQGAHQNGLEAFPMFAAAVLMAHAAGVPTERASLAATLFIYARLGYTVVYGLNTNARLAYLRSTLWMVGVGCTLWLSTSAAALARK